MSGAVREIETRNASIDTLAVTIRALHVSGKQMTLSVFRQLPRTPAYEKDNTLVEGLQHWGIVRYPIKDEGAVWLVASRDGVLWRCRVDVPRITVQGAWRRLEERHAALDAFLDWERQEKLAKDYEARWCAASGDGERTALGPRPPGADWRLARQAGWKVGQGPAYERQVAAADRELAQEERLEEAMSELLALPQLFIAV